MTAAAIHSFAADFAVLTAERRAQVAMIDGKNDAEFTYGELGALAARAAATLDDAGIRAGDVVVSLLPNSVEAIAVFLACGLTGVGFAPLTAQATAREIADWVRLVSAKLVVLPSSAPPAAKAAAEGCGVTVIETSIDGECGGLSARGAELGTGQPAARLYLMTSGTTGEPKALVLDFDRLWSSGLAFASLYPTLGPAPRFWNYLPVSYLGGLFNLCLIPLAFGGSFVVSEQFSGPTLLTYWQNVYRYEIDVLWLVPTIVRGLLQLHRPDSPKAKQAGNHRVRAALLGTAPISLEQKTAFENAFSIPVYENFGLSETTFISIETEACRERRVEGAVGAVSPFVEARVVAEAAGQPGEIAVRTPFLFLGYLQADGSLRLELDAEGRFRTGDVGRLDGDGTLLLTGRLRDVIKKGGYFLALREIELLAESHAAIEEAIAVGVRHDFYGEDYVLFVRAAGKPDDAVASLRHFLVDNLARYKLPAHIEAVAEFPRTASGKVRKGVLLSETGSKFQLLFGEARQ